MSGMKTIVYLALVVGGIFGVLGMNVSNGTLMLNYLPLSLIGAYILDRIFDPAFDSKGAGRTSSASPVMVYLSWFLGVVLVLAMFGLASMTGGEKFTLLGALGIGLEMAKVIAIVLIAVSCAMILVMPNTAGANLFTTTWIVSAIAVTINNPGGFVQNFLYNLVPIKILQFIVFVITQAVNAFATAQQAVISVI